MKGRPTTSMKKGWLYRTSYDENNWEIALVMMIQIQRWSRSSDIPDPLMIQTQWWSSDDPDPVMKITWRWRWLDVDPDDTEKKTCADKLCRENTFLVKKECWCNCNFRMYFLSIVTDVHSRMYCNVFESCHTPMFILGSFYNEKIMSSHWG